MDEAEAVRDEFSNLKDLPFAPVKGPDGRKEIFLMDLVVRRLKGLTLRWGVQASTIKAGERMVAHGKINWTKTQRMIVDIEEVVGPLTLDGIDAQRELRTELLEAESLPDSDDAWALLKKWIRTWRRGIDIEAAQDFYIFRFAPDRQSVI